MVKRSRAESPPPDPDAAVKYVHVDAADEPTPAHPVMTCHLPPHRPLEFASYEEYDVHYQKTHVNRCSECNKNFPSEQILNLHLAEIHDPINDARKARGEKIYACFAEGCDKKCSEPNKRRMHMVAKHHFPQNYDFAIIKDGIDGRTSMLRSSRHDLYALHPKKTKPAKSGNEGSLIGTTAGAKQKQSSPDPSNAMDITTPAKDEPSSATSPGHDLEMKTENGSAQGGLYASKHATSEPFSAVNGAPQQKGRQKKDDVEPGQGEKPSGSSVAGDDTSDPMEGLTNSLSALKFIPLSIRFGRGGRGRARGRGGFARS